jgi:ferredoxin
MLEALEACDIQIPNLCRGGVCGQCVTGYSQGEVEHLDHYLSVQEQQHSLMPCVSRAQAGRIHLDYRKGENAMTIQFNPNEDI